MISTDERHVTCPECLDLKPRNLESETQAFVKHLGIEAAPWQDRIDKLVEELRERRETVLGPSTLDEKISEFADVAIVCLINYLRARDELADLGVSPDAAMVAKMDEVRRRDASRSPRR